MPRYCLRSATQVNPRTRGASRHATIAVLALGFSQVVGWAVANVGSLADDGGSAIESPSPAAIAPVDQTETKQRGTPEATFTSTTFVPTEELKIARLMRATGGAAGATEPPIPNDPNGLNDHAAIDKEADKGDEGSVAGGAQPANDFCGTATVIPSTANSFNPGILDTTGATTDIFCEVAETCEFQSLGSNHSVWYEYTPSCDGMADINTNGSNYDTVLSIWNGCASFNFPFGCDTPTQLACDDDSGTGLQSQIDDFAMLAGNTYLIRVAAWNSMTGVGGNLDFNFTYSTPNDPNDACSSATVIPEDVANYNPAPICTVGAGTSLCEPAESCEFNGAGTSHSVWYEFTPLCDGSINVSTIGSDYDTVLAIFDGCGFLSFPTCNFPEELACDDDSGGPDLTSQIVDFAVTGGTTYMIKASAWNSTATGGLLRLHLTYNVPPPTNNGCFAATTIASDNYNPPLLCTIRANTDLCEAAEDCEFNAEGVSDSVWYEFTPSCSGTLDVDTIGTDYDTVLSIFNGCGFLDFFPNLHCEFPDQIECDDDSGPGLLSQLVDVPVDPDTTYLIKAARWDNAPGGGLLDFNLTFHPDDTAPIAAITSPTVFGCGCAMVSVTGTANDPNGTLEEYRLEYAPAGGGVWTLINSSTTPVIAGALGTWNTAALTEGYYSLRLTARNDCGLVNTAFTVVLVGKMFDAVSVGSPNNGNILAGTVCFGGTITDNQCFANYTVGYRPAGVGMYSPVDPANPMYLSGVINSTFATWNTIALANADGNYDVRVVGNDLCGNSTTVTRTVRIDNTNPIAVITQPLSCEHVDGVVQVRGTASDANIAGWTLQYAGGNGANWVTIASGNTSVNNGVLANWNTAGLPACAYTLRLIVSDQAVVNCGPSTHSAEYLVSVNAGTLCPVDLDGDDDEDLMDYAEFQNCFDGP